MLSISTSIRKGGQSLVFVIIKLEQIQSVGVLYHLLIYFWLLLAQEQDTSLIHCCIVQGSGQHGH